jgi:hypothetical protein
MFDRSGAPINPLFEACEMQIPGSAVQ